jgi:DoxX
VLNIERPTTPWWFLRVGVGVAAFLAGLDTLFNLFADWPAYLSPIAAQILPLGPASFLHVIGGSEIMVGVVILAGYTRSCGASRTIVCRLNRFSPPTPAARSFAGASVRTEECISE